MNNIYRKTKRKGKQKKTNKHDINTNVYTSFMHLRNLRSFKFVSNPISLGIVPVKELKAARFKTKTTRT